MKNIPTKVETDDLTSSEFNEIANELETSVTSGGLTLSTSDQEQISKSIALYIAKQNWSIDSGAANAYVLSVPSPFKAAPSYEDGMAIVFSPGNVNTGASTLNYNTIGVKSIYLNGSDLVGGELTNIAIVQYNLALDVFELIYVHQELFFDGLQVKTVSLASFDVTYLSYSGNSFSVASQNALPEGLFFKNDGTAMYMAGDDLGSIVYQYTLTTAWDISTASYASKSFDMSSQDSSPRGIFFKEDGLKMYMISLNNNTVYQYTLTTAWDVSTASYATKSFDMSAQDTAFSCMFFKGDGSKVYAFGLVSNDIFQYTLTTPWDISTAGYDTKFFDVSTQDTATRSIFLSPDGEKLYTVGQTNDNIYQYALTTAWDISTATYGSISFDISSETTASYELFISSDFSNFYVLNEADDTIYQYESDVVLYV